MVTKKKWSKILTKHVQDLYAENHTMLTKEKMWINGEICQRSNQSILKEISPEYSLEDWCWSWSSNTSATWCKELTYWKSPRCWERLKAGEGDDRGWDDWIASPTRWTWVWASSRSWWWTGKPGMLQSMASQRVGHDWATELNWTVPKIPGREASGTNSHTTVTLLLSHFSCVRLCATP